MSDVMGKFCPVCGSARPQILSKRIHLTKNQRYRCDACDHEFTIHVDESENQVDRFLRVAVPDAPVAEDIRKRVPGPGKWRSG